MVRYRQSSQRKLENSMAAQAVLDNPYLPSRVRLSICLPQLQRVPRDPRILGQEYPKHHRRTHRSKFKLWLDWGPRCPCRAIFESGSTTANSKNLKAALSGLGLVEWWWVTKWLLVFWGVSVWGRSRRYARFLGGSFHPGLPGCWWAGLSGVVVGILVALYRL